MSACGFALKMEPDSPIATVEARFQKSLRFSTAGKLIRNLVPLELPEEVIADLGSKVGALGCLSLGVKGFCWPKLTVWDIRLCGFVGPMAFWGYTV